VIHSCPARTKNRFIKPMPERAAKINSYSQSHESFFVDKKSNIK